MDEKEKYVLTHLYEELRHYRTKEFQTFIFTFPTVAAGLLPSFSSLPSVVILVTFFGLVMINYIVKNHFRMLKIKSVILKLQSTLDINGQFYELEPKDWAGKEFKAHLGTFTYVFILGAELIAVWREPIMLTIQNAAS